MSYQLPTRSAEAVEAAGRGEAAAAAFDESALALLCDGRSDPATWPEPPVAKPPAAKLVVAGGPVAAAALAAALAATAVVLGAVATLSATAVMVAAAIADAASAAGDGMVAALEAAAAAAEEASVDATAGVERAGRMPSGRLCSLTVPICTARGNSVAEADDDDEAGEDELKGEALGESRTGVATEAAGCDGGVGGVLGVRSTERSMKREGLWGRGSGGPPPPSKPRRPNGAKTEAGEPTSSRVSELSGRSGGGGASQTARLQFGQRTWRRMRGEGGGVTEVRSGRELVRVVRGDRGTAEGQGGCPRTDLLNQRSMHLS